MEVCDKVDAKPEDGYISLRPDLEGVNLLKGQKMRLRLLQRDLPIETQMSNSIRSRYTPLFMIEPDMQLAESLSKNCGTKVHREIASRPFTQAILQLVNDRVPFSSLFVSNLDYSWYCEIPCV